MEIREAQKCDYPKICSLINNELGYPDVKLDDLTRRMDMMNQDKNYYTFVALLDNDVVGFIGALQDIAFEVSGFMRIIALAVSKDYQNKGVGSSLLKHVEGIAISKGITIFALNCGLQRLDSHRFYERNGYVSKSYGFSKEVDAAR